MGAFQLEGCGANSETTFFGGGGVKYGDCETHPYSYICFVVFLKKFFPFM